MSESVSSSHQHDAERLAAFKHELANVSLALAHSLSRRLPRLRARLERGQPIDRALNDCEQQIEASKSALEQRRQQPLTIRYPDQLPVSAKRESILKALDQHQVIVVAGETGSGKTTQLPKLCRELGLGIRGQIGHTQPRRLAARSVAARLAEELETPVGESVGYQMRFADHTGPATRVKLMTDGILLAETQHDPDLRRYDAIIIDEAHERSLNIDFLLGYLKRLLARRDDLKIIITSATIDLDRFAQHFSKEIDGKTTPAPIIEVSGRTFPVETLYRPLVRSGDEEEDISLQEGILRAVDEIERVEREKGWWHGPRDVLVFLPGERDIRETADQLRRARLRDTEILPLYARLSAAEQNRVFASHSGRRIVLATNVAETSLTVPGIRYVIDPGQARISRYSYRAQVQRLPIEPVSQASAEQRKGRCGRIAEGLCIRLYDEEDFRARPVFTDPEIKRTNLAAVILSMLALKLGDISEFPFLDAPDPRFVRDGFRLLEELGAVEKNRITKMGRQLSRLPIDPRLARMVVAGSANGNLRETLMVVSALAVQDPRERPADKREAADQAHREWADPVSDFAGWINLWRGYQAAREELSASQLRRWCKSHYLNFMRLREWHDTYRQLRQLARELDLADNEAAAEVDYPRLHQALLTGLLSHLGLKQEGREYLGARNRRFMIHPSSHVSKKPPKWVMAFELLETSRLFAREVAAIKPEWLESAAGSLVKKSHAEPHWEARRGQVVALEQGTLFGVPLYANRRVAYGHINPSEAREIFIRTGLVEGELRTSAAFMSHNQALIAEVENLEDKVRRRDILVDEETLFDFYNERIPDTIHDSRSFEKWRRQAEAEDARFLHVDKQALMAREADEITEVQYPEQFKVEGVELPLDYHFAPGSKDDGVTVTVPALMLSTLPRERFDWLVPGLQREKAIALLKGLPKQYRRQVVPIPDWVDAALEAITPGQQPMGVALGEFLRKRTGLKVDASLWNELELPDHLKANFRVVDANGKELGQGRELDALIARYRDLASQQGDAAAASAAEGQQHGLTAFPAQPLDDEVTREQAGIRLRLYPAVVDEGDTLGVDVFDHPAKAQQALRKGVMRAAMLALPEQYRYFSQHKQVEQLALLYTQVGAKRELQEDLMNALFERVFCLDPLPRSAAQMKTRVDEMRGNLGDEFNQLCRHTERALQAMLALQKQIKKARIGLDTARSYADVKAQLHELVHAGFICQAGAWLEHYPRYLEAAAIRLEKVARETRRDQLAMDEVLELKEKFDARCARDRQVGIADAAIASFFWELQELRVSLFAQQLGTVHPVSVKRLTRHWQEITRGNGDH